MKQALIDTDTLSYYFRNTPQVVEKMAVYSQFHGTVNFSIITYYEVLNGLYYKDAKAQLIRFENIMSASIILPMSLEIANLSAKIYADLRKKGLSIGHNDTIIAGTALVHDMVLVTNNTDHYSRIEGLQLDNWSL